MTVGRRSSRGTGCTNSVTSTGEEPEHRDGIVGGGPLGRIVVLCQPGQRRRIASDRLDRLVGREDSCNPVGPVVALDVHHTGIESMQVDGVDAVVRREVRDQRASVDFSRGDRSEHVLRVPQRGARRLVAATALASIPAH